MKYLLPFILFVPIVFSCNNKKEKELAADLAIKDVTVIDGTGQKPSHEAQTIYVKNGRIYKIGKDKAISYSDSIDGKGKYLIPGLFDAHFHLTRDSSNIQRSLKQLVHFGVTNIFLPGSSLAPYSTMTYIDSLERNNLLISPSIRYASLFLTLSGAHPIKTYPKPDYWIDGKNIHILKDTSNIPSIIKEAKENGATAVKLVVEDGPTPPFIDRIKPSWIKMIARETHKNKMMLVTHISDMEEVRLSVENGADGLMHFTSFPIDWEKDRDIIEKIRQDTIYWVTTLTMGKGMIGYPLHPEWLDSKEWQIFDIEKEELKASQEESRKSAEMILKQYYKLTPEQWDKYVPPTTKDVIKLDSLGVKIVVGTDVGSPAYTVPGLSVHEEMQLYQDGGMSPLRIIKCATLNTAEMLKIADKYGSIEEGKFANLILLDKNPLEDISNTLSINTVLKKGKVQERISNTNYIHTR